MQHQNNLNKLVFTGILFFLHLIIVAQPDWQHGSIINQQGEEIFGLLKSAESANLLNQCIFRKNMKTKPVTYTPTDIQGVRYTNGKYYISKKIQSDTPVYAEFLVDGTIKFYIVHEKKNRYFIEKDGLLTELINTQTSLAKNGTAYLVYNKEYVQTLLNLLKDAQLDAEIESTELQPASLIQLAQYYQKKVNPGQVSTSFDQTGKRNKNDFSIFTSIPMQKISFGGVIESDYNPAFTIGGSYEYTNYVLFGSRFSLKIDLSYLYMGNCTLSQGDAENSSWTKVIYNNSTYTITNNSTSYYGVKELNVNLKTHMLRFPLSVNYYVLNDKIPVYLGVGMSNYIVLSYIHDFSYIKFENEVGTSIPTYQLGLIGRLGCKYLVKTATDILQNSRTKPTNRLIQTKIIDSGIT